MNVSLALPPINEVERLLRIGENSVKVERFEPLARLGLLWLDASAGRAIVGSRCLRIAAALPNRVEALAAVFACLPELRQAWTRIVAARLREAGKRRDAAELCQVIETLGQASGRVREELASGSLQPSGHQSLENELFGAAAEQAVVYPKLLRVIGATAWLMEGTGKVRTELPPLPHVDPLKPKESWCAGRVIQLPSVSGTALAARSVDVRMNAPSTGKTPTASALSLTYVLRGDCGTLADEEMDAADDRPWRALMRWVLFRPWCMLLAQIVFTQEAWGAEQISGQLTLELGEDQISNPYEPKRVDVVVTTPDGDEILCGSLGELVMRILDRLQITLLARPEDVARLDEQLAGVIRLLLERKVWRFDPRGAGGSRPGYMIDDDFSTSCYRQFGSKYFYRAGSVLTAAIRTSAEQWAQQRQASSREVVGLRGMAAAGGAA